MSSERTPVGLVGKWRGEHRIALVPKAVGALCVKGADVTVKVGAGALLPDKVYADPVAPPSAAEVARLPRGADPDRVPDTTQCREPTKSAH